MELYAHFITINLQLKLYAISMIVINLLSCPKLIRNSANVGIE